MARFQQIENSRFSSARLQTPEARCIAASTLRCVLRIFEVAGLDNKGSPQESVNALRAASQQGEQAHGRIQLDLDANLEEDTDRT